MNAEQELWAVALWVEKNHREGGPRFIGEQIGRLALERDKAGVSMWLKVATRFDALKSPKTADGAS